MFNFQLLLRRTNWHIEIQSILSLSLHLAVWNRRHLMVPLCAFQYRLTPLIQRNDDEEEKFVKTKKKFTKLKNLVLPNSCCSSVHNNIAFLETFYLSFPLTSNHEFYPTWNVMNYFLRFFFLCEQWNSTEYRAFDKYCEKIILGNDVPTTVSCYGQTKFTLLHTHSQFSYSRTSCICTHTQVLFWL